MRKGSREESRAFHTYMVRKMGLEPTRPLDHQILNLARLPVPPLSHIRSCIDAENLPLGSAIGKNPCKKQKARAP